MAFMPLGFRCVGISEVDKYCNRLIESKYNYKNYGDFTKWKEWGHINADIVVGGTPCTAFSFVGRREGTASIAGRLTPAFVQFVSKQRPRYFIWENVAGVLSIDKGRLFQWMCHQFQKCGYGLGYRILDARYFGVAQRRRRVFLVGSLGDAFGAGKILFDSETLPLSFGEIGKERHTHFRTVAIGHENNSTEHDHRYRLTGKVSGTLKTQLDGGVEQVNSIVIDGNRLRYLTPVECERLMGFPDNYSAGFSDTRRYKMLGNSMVVPVIRWIGERILSIDRETTGWAKAG